MKITRLDPGKIKVFLSTSDLCEMNIDPAELSPASPQLAALLDGVISAVQKETDFSAGNARLIVETYIFKDGIELFLSRTQKIRHIAAPSRAIFEFADSESLLALIGSVSCSALAAMRLYSYRGRLYLSVLKRKTPPAMCEFSLKTNDNPLSDSFLAEHGQLLADGFRLLSIAFGLKKLN